VLRTAVVIGLLLALIGLFYQPFIGAEAISLLQLCYFAPAVLEDSLIGIKVVTEWKIFTSIVNGYNGLDLEGLETRQLSETHSEMGYHYNFIENVNYMLFVQIVIMVLGVFLRLMAQDSNRLLKLSEKTLKLAFYFAAFNAINVGFSITTNLRFGSDEGVLAANIILGLTAIAMILYHIINHFVNSD
jgi:hypothetical protein